MKIGEVGAEILRCGQSDEQEDERFIRETFDLALRGAGHTSPNPFVGAVIVKNGKVISRGFHRSFRDHHAEVEAIRGAKEGSNTSRQLRGATLYVNLEPCCHTGLHQPCTDAIIASGIRRVVASIIDPFPQVNGKGFAALRKAGIEVRKGVLSGEAFWLNRFFIFNQQKGLPYIIAKAASSLDGKVAISTGDSKWLSGPVSLGYAHFLRQMCDAVMVGIGTVKKDNPRLTVRNRVIKHYLDQLSKESQGSSVPKLRLRNPVRVLVDKGLEVPLDSLIFDGVRDEENRLILLASDSMKGTRKAHLLSSVGAELVFLPTFEARGRKSHRALGSLTLTGRFRAKSMLKELYKAGIRSIMLEGGPGLITDFLRQEALNEFQLVVTPKIIGSEGKPLIGPLGISEIRRILSLKKKESRPLCEDSLIVLSFDSREGTDV